MTPTEINAAIDAVQKECIDKFEALRMKFTKLKYEVGKWYKMGDEHPFYISKIIKNEIHGYGFGDNGKWFNECIATYHYLTDSITDANTSEVLEALKKEAVKLGFEKGCVANNSNIHDQKYGDYKFGDGEFNYEDGALFWYESEDERWRVFEKGTWATLIAPVKEKTTEESIKIGTRFTFKDGSYTMSIKSRSKELKHEFVAFENPKIYTVIAKDVSVRSTCNPEKTNNLIAVDDFGDVVFCSELNIKPVYNA